MYQNSSPLGEGRVRVKRPLRFASSLTATSPPQMCILYDINHNQLVVWSRAVNAWIPLDAWTEGQDTWPGYIAPVLIPDWTDRQRTRAIQPAQWGLMPFWANEKGPKPLHARSETIVNNPMFRDALRTGRCIAPMTGFCEQVNGRWIRFSGEKLLPVAAVSVPPNKRCTSPTFSLVTTEPNDVVRPAQDRMVVVLKDENVDQWLDPSASTEDLLSLCEPCPNDWLKSEDIGPNTRKKSPPKDDLQGTLF